MEQLGQNTFSINDAKVILQDLLNNEHPAVEKRQIKNSTLSYQCACPVCGDSARDNYAKRGHLYYSNLFYRCYNCDWRGSFISLLNYFDIRVDPEKKLEMSEYVSNAMDRVKFDEDEFISKSLDKLIDLDTLTEYFNNNPKSPITSFRPIQKGSKVYKYLVGRKVYNFDNIYEGTFWYTNSWSEPVMINMNMNGEKVIGIQTRNLKGRDNRRFKVFKFSELWDLLYPNEPLDEIEQVGYNKLSYFYGIMNVDWSRPITIFEGYTDTKFFPNSIGCVGTNTDMNILLSQEAYFRFFYDHDKTGLKKTKQRLEEGHSVFLWNKLFKDWSKTRSNPNKAYRKLKENIVDLNDVAKIVDNPYRKLEMENHFSYDEFDLIYVEEIYDSLNDL